jgi:ABC-type transporter Mla subunit MlaD
VASKRSELDDRFSYLDMLISAIVDHEKNLNDLILRLERVVEKISEVMNESLKKRS